MNSQRNRIWDLYGTATRPRGRPMLPFCAWVILVCVMSMGVISMSPGARAATPKLVVQGEAIGNGIFDPSVEVDPTTGVPWLTYSVVYGTAQPWGPHVESHLASTPDGGATWIFETTLNQSEPGEIVLDGVVRSGFWNREVSSLAYDPTDVGSEWKLIVHKIFRLDTDPFVGEQTVASHSWLELHEAAAPTGPWQLVTRLGSGPLPPAEYPIDQALNGLDGMLQNVLVYSEPGLFAHAGLLYLSLSALSPTPTIPPEPSTSFRAEVILLSSSDHGATWDWVAPLITTTQAELLGYEDFGGSAIVEDGGYQFLLASPGTTTLPRLGTATFLFADLAAGDLVMQGAAPRLFEQIPLQPEAGGVLFGGQADYHEDAALGGILMNQLETADWPEVFQVRETGHTPLPEPMLGGSLCVGVLTLIASRRFKRRS